MTDQIESTTYDGAERVIELLEHVAAAWTPCQLLRNQERRWAEMEPAAFRAVVVANVEHLPGFTRDREIGNRYLTLANATELTAALTAFANDAGLADPNQPIAELTAECDERLFQGRRQHRQPTTLTTPNLTAAATEASNA